MSNKNYKRGYQTEYRCAKEFKDNHDWAVRSPSSKGMFDVTAVTWTDGAYLIQLKRSKNKLQYSRYRKEIEAIQVWLADMEMVKGKPKPRWLHVQWWIWIDRKGWTKYEITKNKVLEL